MGQSTARIFSVVRWEIVFFSPGLQRAQLKRRIFSGQGRRRDTEIGNQQSVTMGKKTKCYCSVVLDSPLLVTDTKMFSCLVNICISFVYCPEMPSGHLFNWKGTWDALVKRTWQWNQIWSWKKVQKQDGRWAPNSFKYGAKRNGLLRTRLQEANIKNANNTKVTTPNPAQGWRGNCQKEVPVFSHFFK